MKSIEGIYRDEDENEKIIRINYDFSNSGGIEVTTEDGSIKIPGEMVERFVQAYLSGRKIERIELLPIGYIKQSP